MAQDIGLKSGAVWQSGTEFMRLAKRYPNIGVWPGDRSGTSYRLAGKTVTGVAAKK